MKRHNLQSAMEGATCAHTHSTSKVFKTQFWSREVNQLHAGSSHAKVLRIVLYFSDYKKFSVLILVSF